MVEEQSFKKFLLSQLPTEIITFIIGGIAKIYEDSHDYVFERYEREQAIDHLPYRRIPEIESFLRLLPNRFPIVKVNCELNNSLNYHHVEITINKIVFTQSFCRTPFEKVRNAEFRNSLSAFNIQEKFNFGDNEILETSDKYYAIFRHGASDRQPKSPEFFDFVFPSKSKENFVEPIDILRLFGITLSDLRKDTESIKSNEALNNPPLKTPGKTADKEE